MPRIAYRLSVATPHAHLCEVEAVFSAVDALGTEIELCMAAWTPGSYLIREYGRHVQDLTCRDEEGRELVVTKVAKATWRVSLAGGRDLVASYRVYGHELSVRTNHIDGSHAFLNGAPTYLWIDALRRESAEVTVDVPAGWSVTTALAGGPTTFLAKDTDELIDSPVHMGPDRVLSFEAASRPTSVAVWGRTEAGTAFTLEDLVRDTRTVMEAHASVFGGVPYERYAFLLMLAPSAYGGLEHKASAALLSSPFALSSRKRYEELLELISHEYFHLWNVKRIHPTALGPFAYDREAYTRSLWVMEGLTSYYDRYTLRRTNLQSAKRYLEKLAEEWGKLLAIPGRARQSIEESSFDAWIKLYRPDENSVNSSVSYYLKGGLVTLCLDLEIRRRSAEKGQERSLDDVLRHLWECYGRPERGFADADVQREFERAVELELEPFFTRYVRGREDPDLGGELAQLGLILKASWERTPEEPKDAVPAALGANVRTDAGRLLVSSTLSGSAAEAAGLYAGDEIVALEGFRVDERALVERLSLRKPLDGVRLTIFRRDELRDVVVRLEEKRKDKFEIAPAPTATDAQKARYRAWLGEPYPAA
jgi:predicted metalloprotease with PDZ domain